MKKIKLSIALASLLIAGVAVVSSCKKSTTTTTPTPTPTIVDNDQSGASANNTAENTSNDIVLMGAQASDMSSNTGSLSTYRNSNASQILGLSCATIIRDTINSTIIVTFNGTPCLDGRTRSGSLIYTYTNPNGSGFGYNRYRDPGFMLVVTAQNYIVNSNTVTINSKTITNTTPVGFNYLVTNETWSISANISIALASGAGTINWTSNRIKTLLNTSSVYTNVATPINWTAARISISDGPGDTYGNRSNGETFTVTITNPLIRDFTCSPAGGGHPFIQGTFVYAPYGKYTRTFDYGTGACDDLATLTINGIVYNIILP
jgi:hypothetical protein